MALYAELKKYGGSEYQTVNNSSECQIEKDDSERRNWREGGSKRLKYEEIVALNAWNGERWWL